MHVASCGSIGVEWFGNAADCSYGIENHQRLHAQHTQRNHGTNMHVHTDLLRSGDNVKQQSRVE